MIEWKLVETRRTEPVTPVGGVSNVDTYQMYDSGSVTSDTLYWDDWYSPKLSIEKVKERREKNIAWLNGTEFDADGTIIGPANV